MRISLSALSAWVAGTLKNWSIYRAFLIPYFAMLFMAGLPIFYLELAIGQYVGIGPTSGFKRIAPIFHGLGYGMLMVSFLVMLYYNMIIAYAIFYMGASFSSELGWARCGHPWNTPSLSSLSFSHPFSHIEYKGIATITTTALSEVLRQLNQSQFSRADILSDCFSLADAEDCLKKGNGTMVLWNNTCTLTSKACAATKNLCADQNFLNCLRHHMSSHNNTHCFNISAMNAQPQEPQYQHVRIRDAFERISSSEEYWTNHVLGMSSGWEEYGGIRWQLVLCLFVAWVIVAVCLIKGVQSSGKVVYFTALFPYLVLLIFLIYGIVEKRRDGYANTYQMNKLRISAESISNLIYTCIWSALVCCGTTTFCNHILIITILDINECCGLCAGATLPGAKDGVLFYLTPQWEQLTSVGVWYKAATQIFYSLGPAFGGLLTLASYNRFNNNCQRDGITVALSNCMTSFFAGFVIYSIVGFMAHELDVEVKNVIRDGTGLAFVAYPDAVARMPIPQLWAFLFFLMLITLGLDSQV
ncbi:unnamed protein product, partial [Darwinula stevensoni]